MPQKRIPKQALPVIPNGKMPVRWSRLRWLNHIEDLGRNPLGLSLGKMKEIMKDCDVWKIWRCCHRNPNGKARKEKSSNYFKIKTNTWCVNNAFEVFLFSQNMLSYPNQISKLQIGNLVISLIILIWLRKIVRATIEALAVQFSNNHYIYIY